MKATVGAFCRVHANGPPPLDPGASLFTRAVLDHERAVFDHLAVDLQALDEAIRFQRLVVARFAERMTGQMIGSEEYGLHLQERSEETGATDADGNAVAGAITTTRRRVDYAGQYDRALARLTNLIDRRARLKAMGETGVGDPHEAAGAILDAIAEMDALTLVDPENVGAG